MLVDSEKVSTTPDLIVALRFAQINGPFLSCLLPLFQNEPSFETVFDLRAEDVQSTRFDTG